jgi:predicted DNA-binding transcriptional regulator YafY
MTPPVRGQANDGEATPAAPVDPNQAKLELAAIHGLRAKFVYTNLKGETHEVRLEPETVNTQAGRAYVWGHSFDEDGDPEGYKQYRLDSIEGAVAIR